MDGLDRGYFMGIAEGFEMRSLDEDLSKEDCEGCRAAAEFYRGLASTKKISDNERRRYKNLSKAYKNLSDNSQSEKEKKLYLNRSIFFERLSGGKVSLRQALLLYFSQLTELVEKN